MNVREHRSLIAHTLGIKKPHRVSAGAAERAASVLFRFPTLVLPRSGSKDSGNSHRSPKGRPSLPEDSQPCGTPSFEWKS